MSQDWTDAHHRVIKDVLSAAFPGAQVSTRHIPHDYAIGVELHLGDQRFESALTRGRQDAPDPSMAAGLFQQYFTQRIKQANVAG